MIPFRIISDGCAFFFFYRISFIRCSHRKFVKVTNWKPPSLGQAFKVDFEILLWTCVLPLYLLLWLWIYSLNYYNRWQRTSSKFGIRMERLEQSPLSTSAPPWSSLRWTVEQVVAFGKLGALQSRPHARFLYGVKPRFGTSSGHQCSLSYVPHLDFYPFGWSIWFQSCD